MPSTGGIFGLAAPDRVDRRVLNVVGRVEIGLADGKRDDFPALGFQIARLLRDHHGRGGLDPIQRVGQEGHRFNSLTARRDWRRAGRGIDPAGAGFNPREAGGSAETRPLRGFRCAISGLYAHWASVNFTICALRDRKCCGVRPERPCGAQIRVPSADPAAVITRPVAGVDGLSPHRGARWVGAAGRGGWSALRGPFGAPQGEGGGDGSRPGRLSIPTPHPSC